MELEDGSVNEPKRTEARLVSGRLCVLRQPVFESFLCGCSIHVMRFIDPTTRPRMREYE